nr:hypothetical protein CIT39_04360 [Bradyrhizobium symbiodeficiens]
MKDRVAENRVSDIKLAIAGFATVLFAFAGGYLLIDSKLAKLSEKLDAFAVSNAKIETKLDDLIARIPPVPTSPPRRN